MLKFKGQLFQPANKQQSQINSGINSISQLNIQKNHYHFSRQDKANEMSKQLNCKLLSILAIFIFMSAMIYLMSVALRYVVITTHFYGNSQHCLQSEMHFNGWNFIHQCQSCIQHYVLDVDGLCVEQH